MTPRFSRRRTLIRLLFRRGGVIIGPRAADFIRASRSIHTDVPRKYPRTQRAAHTACHGCTEVLRIACVSDDFVDCGERVAVGRKEFQAGLGLARQRQTIEIWVEHQLGSLRMFDPVRGAVARR